MSVYTKSKTSASKLATTEVDTAVEGSFKVGLAEGADRLVLDYLTSLYANPETAVVRELFTNASDASRKTKKPITISIDESASTYNADNPENSTSYKFVITDYGCGMSKKEMEKNYITYASSSKIDNYNVQGSFGLGSKSPASLVPSYVVTSNNGKEENTYKVARTEQGIYAVPGTIKNKSDHSFTTVEVDGLSHKQAQAMAQYVADFILPFSQHAVEAYDCFGLYASGKKRSFNHAKISLFKGFNTTVYSKNLRKDVLVAFRGAVPKSAWLVRINDIVYPLFKQEYDASFNVVIDIEPGYFAFAPSREELPSGDKLEHIKEIIKSPADFKNEVKFVKESGLFEQDEILSFYRREAFTNFESNRGLLDVFGDKMYLVRKIMNAIENDTPITWDTDNIKIRRFWKRGEYKKFEVDELTPESLLDCVQKMVEIVKEDYALPIIGKKSSTRISPTTCHSEVKVINGVKFNKNTNEPILHSSEYKVNGISKRLNEMCSTWECSMRQSFLVLLKGDTQITEELKFLLSFLNYSLTRNMDAYSNSHTSGSHIFTDVLTYQEVYPKARRSAARKPRVSTEDKMITLAEISDTGYFGPDMTGRAGDVIAKNSIFLTKAISGELFPLISFITGKKVYRLRDRSRAIHNYLTKQGGIVININIGKRRTLQLNELDTAVDEFGPGADSKEFRDLINSNKIFKYGYISSNGTGEISSRINSGELEDYLAENEPETYKEILYAALKRDDSFCGKELTEFAAFKPKRDWSSILGYRISGGYATAAHNSLINNERSQFCREILDELFDIDALIKHSYEFWALERLQALTSDIDYCNFEVKNLDYYARDMKGSLMRYMGCEILRDVL